MKTKKQLDEIGLKPVKPVGRIETKNYTCFLYDIDDANSVRPKKQPTDKQLEALKKARIESKKRAWMRRYGWVEKYRIDAVKSAMELLKSNDWVILDTETTGLYDAEIIEISVINSSKEPLLNTRIKPTIPITPGAYQVHGIGEEDLINSPSFPDVYQNLKSAIENKLVLIYNSDFDAPLISENCVKHGLPKIKFKSLCVMLLYAQWYGHWSDYWDGFECQRLPGGDHSALGDCLACLACLKEMSSDSDEIKYPDFEGEE
ncbi:3'-5' exonuclease [Nodularia spumigena]|uniref:3'-5' exonuclease n=1 Tax=Nodularia spumigena TaxID=70799 RepID=UPI002B2155CF|nr:3'-5' exonuclease [Nodularia spumigena]MEA5559345.1 3'-5' exonuclease [Nodularia spumigena CH309]